MASFISGKHLLLSAGIGLWLAAAAFGTKQLNQYAFTPGEISRGDDPWPAGATVLLAPRAPTILLALHPECPCSRATLEELYRVRSDSGRSPHVTLLFLDTDPDHPAVKSELYARAGELGQCTRILDTSGVEFKRFGFRTSGEARIYREDGALLYAGGLTGSRGHVGDNPGRQGAISALHSSLMETRPTAIRRPTFGCAFFDDAR